MKAKRLKTEMMRFTTTHFRVTLLIAITFSIFVDSRVLAKYDRVMVLPGGGLQAAMYLGMIEGAELSGKTPDVVISTCGASVAAAVANAFPDSENRRQFIQSEVYYELLKTLDVRKGDRYFNSSNFFMALSKIIGMHWRALFPNRIPSLFSGYIVDVPSDFQIPDFSRPFS